MGYLGNVPKNIKNTTIVNASSGQTNFTVTGGYTGTAIDVYQNGVKLVLNSDFTLPSSPTVTLVTAATENDVIELVAYSLSEAYSLYYTQQESDNRYTSNSKLLATTTVFG